MLFYRGADTYFESSLRDDGKGEYQVVSRLSLLRGGVGNALTLSFLYTRWVSFHIVF